MLHSGRVRSRSDLLVALGLLVLGQAEVAYSGVEGSASAAHLLWGAVALAAYFRRSHPLVFAGVCVGGLVPAIWLDLVPEWSVVYPVAAPLSVFGLGLYGRRSIPAAVGALGFAFAAVAIVWLNQETGEAGRHYLGFEWVRLITIYAGAAGAGILLRDRTDALAAAAARLDALPPAGTEVDAEIARARQEIAREMYAAVKSCLDRIGTAIEEARRRLPRSPASAGVAAERARSLSRQAMDEMRRMLGVLRAEDSGSSARPPAPDRPTERRHRLLDLLAGQALVLLVFANGVLNAFVTSADADLIGGDLALGWRLVGATVTAAAFLPRRRWPLVTVVGVPAILFLRVYVFDDRLPLDLFVWSAAFVAAAYLTPRPVAVAGGVFVLAAALGTSRAIEPATPWQAYTAFSITTAVVWMVGYACRERVAQTTEIRRLEAEERVRREREKERAVREEKLALARELHDVVGHNLTAITLQCAGVERLIPAERSRAAEILGTVGDLVREANRELIDLFVALSGYREPPLPRLESLPDLAERVRGQGTEVSLDTSGDLSLVPAGPGAAAFRIVQESLANAGKHSTGPVAARVDLLPDRIELLIVNPQEGEPGDGFQLGLVGIRERAEAYGGSLRAGPDGHGSWRVQAELPVSPATISPLS